MPSDPSAAACKALNVQQQAFSNALLAADLPLPPDVVGPTREKKAQKRFAVYRNNVLAGLTEALTATFPTISQLLGDEFFRAMARVYIAASPPRSPMLISYGSDFGDFLNRFEPLADLPFLGDVARLEHAWLRSYNAADATPLDPQKLQSIAPDRIGELVFDFHPAAELITSNHPVYSIWAAHKSDDPEAVMASIEPKPESVLITRPHWDVSVVSLPTGGAPFIRALMKGLPLAEAAESAAAADDAFDFAQNLGGLFETGALASIHLPIP
ncbi:DNA-binding domain-containing protein [uncultured Cohaesibacter sp.]|uniref:HvfC/BufC N-terminal domain-containing protein n=1 Tax=uncultured Cohaesibacter sp. TaxID=1002546 RepID=UPI0029C8C7FF|nr:DNA-binding domain-containing protein [uncultured Cohaesibacter sp.]